MADKTENLARMAVDVPQALRDDYDRCGDILGLNKTQVMREALEYFVPILRQRAADRLALRAQAEAVEVGV